MRFGLAVLGIIALTAGPALAQFRGFNSGYGRASARFAARSPSAASGFGSVLFPGTGGPPPMRRHTNFPRALSATVGAYSNRIHVGTAGLGRNLTGRQPYLVPRHNIMPRRPVVYPVAYPVYVGGYNYATPYQQPVHVTVQNVAAPQPPVIINQYYQTPNATPVLKTYSDGQLPETPDQGMRHFQAPTPTKPTPAQLEDAASETTPAQIDNADRVEPQATIYLIAYKDQTIYPALGYWVEDDTLHYLTAQGSHNRASLELIDEDFSRQLNQERGIEFELEVH